jgi:hypothetical protein
MHRRARRLAVTGALSALAVLGPTGLLAACGGGSDSASKDGGSEASAGTNGLEKKPANEVVKDASSALRTANSVHLVGTQKDEDGLVTSMDLRMQGGDTAGTLKTGDGSAEIIRTGGVTYVKGNRQYYEAEGATKTVVAAASDRWVKVPNGGEGSGLTLTDFAENIGDDSDEVSAVQQSVLDGSKVVVVSGSTGTTGYVANVGSPVMLRLEKSGEMESDLSFTEYGKQFTFSPPPGAIDLPS